MLHVCCLSWQAVFVCARFLNLPDSSSSAPLERYMLAFANTFACLCAELCSARLLNSLDSSSSAPLERYTFTDCLCAPQGSVVRAF